MLLASEGSYHIIAHANVASFNKISGSPVIIGCSITLGPHLDMELEDNIIAISNSGSFTVSLSK